MRMHVMGMALLVVGSLCGCRPDAAPEPSVPAAADRPSPPPAAATQMTTPLVEPKSTLQFVECATAWGVNVQYRNGEEAELYTILESLGGGVGVLDYDCDGEPDLYFPGGGGLGPLKQPYGIASRLLRQRGAASHPKYEEVSAESGGVSAAHYSHGVAVSDFDNDGFDDVLVTGFGGLQLFHNLGDGTFEENSQQSGLTDTQWSSSAAWGDFNGDGANDLYVAHYVDWSPENDPPCFFKNNQIRDVCPPRQFTGLPNVVYLSDGAGGFHSPGSDFGDVSQGKGLGVATGDIDLDGDVDVYVTNDNAMNSLLVNDKQTRLVESGAISGTGFGDTGQMDGSMGVDFGDYNGDGFPDIWVTNYENETFALYRSSEGQYFQHVSRSTGVAAAGGLSVGWGTLFGDFDRDGDEDLFAANGHVIRHPTNSPLEQPPLVLLNVEMKRFLNVAAEAGEYTSSPHMSRGIAASDLDHDGDLDLVVSHTNQPAALLRNETVSSGHWIEIELIGTRSPRWAEGAWVEIQTTGQKQIRLKKGGTSYASTSDRHLHVGLGSAESIESLVVHWPSGRIQHWDQIPGDQRFTLTEGVGGVYSRP